MRYVQATIPANHNGGAFYEHEIHIPNPTGGSSASTSRLVKEYFKNSIDQKHSDYRVSSRFINHEVQRTSGSHKLITLASVPVIVVRFKDKDKAMLFKLRFTI